MQDYISLFRTQLEELPNSGYKTQLIKHGEHVASGIFKKSIMSLIADIEFTDKDINYILTESDFRKHMLKPLDLKLSDDLGVCEELIYRLNPNMAKINDATYKLAMTVNNSFMNYILLNRFKCLELHIEAVLNKKKNPRVLIVGNNTIDNLRVMPDSRDLKFVESNEQGDLIFHSANIPVNTIYSIDLPKQDKAITYVVKNPLTIINSEFRHIAGIQLKNPELITKYLV